MNSSSSSSFPNSVFAYMLVKVTFTVYSFNIITSFSFFKPFAILKASITKRADINESVPVSRVNKKDSKNPP